jgi:hypothetical protein
MRAVDPSGALDPDGRLYATSRIWTPQPGTSGTTSQSMPVVALDSIVHDTVLFTGHRTSDQYRVNAGVTNLDREITQTFRVSVSGSVQTLLPVFVDLVVPPYSTAQTAIQWPEDPLLRVAVQVLSQPGGGRGSLWIPYVSSIDNTTGDSWSTLGVEVQK